MVSRACRRLLAPCLLLSFAGCGRAPEGRGQEVSPEKNAVSTGQGGHISPQEEKALRAWRPMARPLAQSFPETRILIRHRMSRAEILSFLDSSVSVEKGTSEVDHFFAPVAASRAAEAHNVGARAGNRDGGPIRFHGQGSEPRGKRPVAS